MVKNLFKRLEDKTVSFLTEALCDWKLPENFNKKPETKAFLKRDHP